MNGNRDLRILQHIIQYCDQINEAILLFGNDYDVFCSNNTYRNACCLCILQIGELVHSLTDEFKAEHKLQFSRDAMQAADPLATQAIRCFAAPVCG